MATIRSSIQITDGMSPAFKAMNNAMNAVINSFESLSRVSKDPINSASITTARQELIKASSAFNQVENEIRQADQQQEKFNQSIRDGKNSANGLLSTVKTLAATYLTFQGVKTMLNLSDQLTQTNARLNMINDNLQSTDELQQMIFESAQRSRASYADTADFVAKIGLNARKAFNNTEEIVMFAEQLNKQFALNGTNAEAVSSAMLQLNQALGSGVLRGEELTSVMETAPEILRKVERYMGWIEGSIKSHAEKGEVTAQVLKNAILSTAEETNKALSEIPMTWGQLFTSFKNHALMAFAPVLEKLNDMIQTEKFQGFVNAIISGLAFIAKIAVGVAELITNNWSLIEPIVWGLVAAFAVYEFTVLASAIATAWKTIVSWAETAAIIAMTWAQQGLNAALALCPLTWIIYAIIALIAVFYLAVAAVNKFAGTSISATGIIAGVFSALFATIYNLIAFCWNTFAAFAEFLVNLFIDPIGAIKGLFANLGITIIDLIISVTKGWDKMATNLVNAIVTAVNWVIDAWNWLIDVIGEDIAGKIGLGKGTRLSYSTSITSDLENLKGSWQSWAEAGRSENYWSAPKMEMKVIGDAYDKGYKWGSDLADKVGNMFDTEKMQEKYMKNLSQDGLLNPDTVQNGLGNSYDDIGGSVGDIANNTAAMKDYLDSSDESLKYLRDLAERETINRFTTSTIKVEMVNNNTLSSDMDIDGVVNILTDKLNEQLATSVTGVVMA